MQTTTIELNADLAFDEVIGYLEGCDCFSISGRCILVTASNDVLDGIFHSFMCEGLL